MITEDYCSFEIAKLLKEKDFNENCYHVYHPIPNSRNVIRYHRISLVNNSSIDEKEDCVCPTLQMARRWLREIHKLEIYPYHQNSEKCDKWWFEIVKFPSPVSEYESNAIYATYEEACEAAIKYCLENLI